MLTGHSFIWQYAWFIDSINQYCWYWQAISSKENSISVEVDVVYILINNTLPQSLLRKDCE